MRAFCSILITALLPLHVGGQLGTIVALITAPQIIDHFGWPAVFQIYGATGLLWMLLWQPLVADIPPLFRDPGQKGLKQQASANGSPSTKDSVATDASTALHAPTNGALPQQPQQKQQRQLQGASAAMQKPYSKMPSIRDLPWRSFFTNKPFLAILMAHASFGAYHPIGKD